MDQERLSLEDVLGLGRFHIVLIAALASVVFGWLLSGSFAVGAGLLVALDWFLLNLWNRVADVPEDARNGISGTSFVVRHRRALSIGALVALGASLLIAQPMPLILARALFQAGGVAYSFRVLPRGLRIKEVFLLKNVFSGLLFILSVIGYPLLLSSAARHPGELLALAAFFLPLEITYELIYDLRDLEGDRAESIVTLPVRLGEARTRSIINVLIACSALSLLLGYFAGALRWAEVILVAAPLQQALVMRFWIPRQVVPRDAIRVTYLGAAQLAAFIVWVGAGLPLERPW